MSLRLKRKRSSRTPPLSSVVVKVVIICSSRGIRAAPYTMFKRLREPLSLERSRELCRSNRFVEQVIIGWHTFYVGALDVDNLQ